ncbi:MAG: CoA transferase, partial [Lautropia sp.]
MSMAARGALPIDHPNTMPTDPADKAMSGNDQSTSQTCPGETCGTGASGEPGAPRGQCRPGPLSGVRVLDLSAYIAGPYGCTLLADQGAEVIKIESPEGDNLRRYPSTLDKDSRAFLGVNRGKTGIV